MAQLLAALRRMQAQRLELRPLLRPSPFAFPLMVERFREKLSNEDLADRIARMLAQLDSAADVPAGEGEPAAPRVQDVVPADPPRRPRRHRAAEPAASAELAEPGPLQAATASVRRMLDFSLTSADAAEGAGSPRRPRRERKPSRPLPRL